MEGKKKIILTRSSSLKPLGGYGSFTSQRLDLILQNRRKGSDTDTTRDDAPTVKSPQPSPKEAKPTFKLYRSPSLYEGLTRSRSKSGDGDSQNQDNGQETSPARAKVRRNLSFSSSLGDKPRYIVSAKYQKYLSGDFEFMKNLTPGSDPVQDSPSSKETDTATKASDTVHNITGFYKTRPRDLLAVRHGHEGNIPTKTDPELGMPWSDITHDIKIHSPGALKGTPVTNTNYHVDHNSNFEAKNKNKTDSLSPLTDDLKWQRHLSVMAIDKPITPGVSEEKITETDSASTSQSDIQEQTDSPDGVLPANKAKSKKVRRRVSFSDENTEIVPSNNRKVRRSLSQQFQETKNKPGYVSPFLEGKYSRHSSLKSSNENIKERPKSETMSKPNQRTNLGVTHTNQVRDTADIYTSKVKSPERVIKGILQSRGVRRSTSLTGHHFPHNAGISSSLKETSPSSWQIKPTQNTMTDGTTSRTISISDRTEDSNHECLDVTPHTSPRGTGLTSNLNNQESLEMVPPTSLKGMGLTSKITSDNLWSPDRVKSLEVSQRGLTKANSLRRNHPVTPRDMTRNNFRRPWDSSGSSNTSSSRNMGSESVRSPEHGNYTSQNSIHANTDSNSKRVHSATNDTNPEPNATTQVYRYSGILRPGRVKSPDRSEEDLSQNQNQSRSNVVQRYESVINKFRSPERLDKYGARLSVDRVASPENCDTKPDGSSAMINPVSNSVDVHDSAQDSDYAGQYSNPQGVKSLQNNCETVGHNKVGILSKPNPFRSSTVQRSQSMVIPRTYREFTKLAQEGKEEHVNADGTMKFKSAMKPKQNYPWTSRTSRISGTLSKKSDSGAENVENESILSANLGNQVGDRTSISNTSKIEEQNVPGNEGESQGVFPNFKSILTLLGSYESSMKRHSIAASSTSDIHSPRALSPDSDTSSIGQPAQLSIPTRYPSNHLRVPMTFSTTKLLGKKHWRSDLNLTSGMSTRSSSTTDGRSLPLESWHRTVSTTDLQGKSARHSGHHSPHSQLLSPSGSEATSPTGFQSPELKTISPSGHQSPQSETMSSSGHQSPHSETMSSSGHQSPHSDTISPSGHQSPHSKTISPSGCQSPNSETLSPSGCQSPHSETLSSPGCQSPEPEQQSPSSGFKSQDTRPSFDFDKPYSDVIIHKSVDLPMEGELILPAEDDNKKSVQSNSSDDIAEVSKVWNSETVRCGRVLRCSNSALYGHPIHSGHSSEPLGAGDEETISTDFSAGREIMEDDDDAEEGIDVTEVFEDQNEGLLPNYKKRKGGKLNRFRQQLDHVSTKFFHFV